MIVEPKREILLGPLVRAGVQRSWAAREHLLRLGAIPLLAMVAIMLPLQNAMFEMWAGVQPGRMPEDGGQMPLIAVLAIAYAVVLNIFAVNWLRQLTLGAGAAPGLGLSLNGRHLRFFFLIIAMSFGSGVLGMILILVLSPFGLAGAGAAIMVSAIAWATLMARVSPSWIGIALDVRMPLAVAWRRTAGHGFKLFIALMAIEVPLMFAQQVIGGIFGITGLLAAAPATFTLVTAAIQLAGTAAQLAVLVTAFPHFLRETA